MDIVPASPYRRTVELFFNIATEHLLSGMPWDVFAVLSAIRTIIRTTRIEFPTMRILIVGPHPPSYGGSAHSCRELASGLRSLGHFVLHVAPYPEPIDPSLYPGVKWVRTEFHCDDLTINKSWAARIERAIVSVLRGGKSFDHIILGRESFLWHLPIIRQMFVGPVTLICRGAYANRLRKIGDHVPPDIRASLIHYYQSCDLIVVIAKHLEETLREFIPTPPPIRFVPNPIDLVHLRNRLSPPTPNRYQQIRLLMACQLKQRKRPLDALPIMKAIRQNAPGALLTICGDGPLREALHRELNQNHLEQAITLVGAVNRDQLMLHLEQAESVLLCSSDEGRPRILEEAVAAGRGVVAYDNPGSREAVGSWPLARIVRQGDTEGAAMALLEIAARLRKSESVPFVSLSPATNAVKAFIAALNICRTNSRS